MASLKPVGEFWGVFYKGACFGTFRTRKEAKRFVAWCLPGVEVA